MVQEAQLRDLATNLFERSIGSTLTLHFGDRKSGPTFVLELDGSLHWRVVELLYKNLEFVDDTTTVPEIATAVSKEGNKVLHEVS